MKTQENTETGKTTISTILLDAKTLLVVSASEKDDYPSVSVKYMEGQTPQETIIAKQTPNTIIEYNERMVAVFDKKTLKRPKLLTIYDVQKHDFASSELLKLNYSVMSYEGGSLKQLVKK